jgi:thiosulfate dehydrogenase
MISARILSPSLALCLAVLAVGLAACSSNKPPEQTVDLALRNATATIPPGRDGDPIRLGRSIVNDTQQNAGRFVVANMNCSACHLNGGTKAKGGSFLGIYAKFPQWNERAHRFIAVQDRVAECFLNSMNGRPPPYPGREMIAVVSYISWLSRGATVGVGFPDQDYPELPIRPSDVASGKTLYAKKCAACHMANGQGVPPTLPPLWGPKSFNDDAGMSHLQRMASFVRFNMPADKPGTLTDQQSYDIADWVLTHPRPAFDKKRLIEYEPFPASYY